LGNEEEPREERIICIYDCFVIYELAFGMRLEE
jgi:hypothetical protein